MQPCMLIRRPSREPRPPGTGGLSFAEYGPPDGQPIVWMHGTPGARRRIPLEARGLAAEIGVRIIGIDRSGIGSSSPYVYSDVLEWTKDLDQLLDALGVDTFRLVGLSGGGPNMLASAAAMPDRVLAAAVLGAMRMPVGFAMTQGIRVCARWRHGDRFLACPIGKLMPHGSQWRPNHIRVTYTHLKPSHRPLGKAHLSVGTSRRSR